MQELGKLQVHESYQLLYGAKLTDAVFMEWHQQITLLDLIIVQTVVIIVVFNVLLFCACVYCAGHC